MRIKVGCMCHPTLAGFLFYKCVHMIFSKYAMALLGCLNSEVWPLFVYLTVYPNTTALSRDLGSVVKRRFVALHQSSKQHQFHVDFSSS